MSSPETAEEVLGRLEPPEASQVALAKLAVQRSLRLDFNEAQHIKCARPPVPGRTWAGMISKVLWQQYGSADGFCPADLEIEAVMLDLDEIIWPTTDTIEAEIDADVQAEKQRILEGRHVDAR